jgi:hypothetical protein
MNSVKISWLTICVIVAVLSLTAFIGLKKMPAKKDIMKTDGKGFAVLELFTSEGCSSCPPADDLMAKIQNEAKGQAIYILAYHVDYWDRQGWKDMYSSSDFSNRQVQYGHWLNVSQIYTPQVIVNGKFEFVGSDESDIRKAISGQLKTNPGATLVIKAREDGEGLIIQYQATQALKSSRLLIAIIEKAAQSKVLRGENAGHTLSHVQIVHKLLNESLSVTGNGGSSVLLPNDFNSKDWEVLGLIQDQGNGEILAVAKADLNDSNNIKK